MWGREIPCLPTPADRTSRAQEPASSSRPTSHLGKRLFQSELVWFSDLHAELQAVYTNLALGGVATNSDDIVVGSSENRCFKCSTRAEAVRGVSVRLATVWLCQEPRLGAVTAGGPRPAV